MRYFAIILVLMINAVLLMSQQEGARGQLPGYTYQINASRVSQTIAPAYPILYMYYQVSQKQNLTYFQSVGPDNPIMLEGYLANDNTVYFMNNDESLLNTCANFKDGTWEYVLVEIFDKGMIPDGSCSAKKDSYTIGNKVAPITVTFPVMINCGEYTAIMNFFVLGYETGNLVWGGQLDFSFEIPDNGNCNES